MFEKLFQSMINEYSEMACRPWDNINVYLQKNWDGEVLGMS